METIITLKILFQTHLKVVLVLFLYIIGFYSFSSILGLDPLSLLATPVYPIDFALKLKKKKKKKKKEEEKKMKKRGEGRKSSLISCKIFSTAIAVGMPYYFIRAYNHEQNNMICVVIVVLNFTQLMY